MERDLGALDFMQDTLYGGRRFRTLNVLDEGNREGPSHRGRHVDPGGADGACAQGASAIECWRASP